MEFPGSGQRSGVSGGTAFMLSLIHILAQRVKEGVREAGGLPLEVMTTGICDGMCLKDPRYIEVPSRNSIADQVEITVEGNFFDGMVMLLSLIHISPLIRAFMTRLIWTGLDGFNGSGM